MSTTAPPTTTGTAPPREPWLPQATQPISMGQETPGQRIRTLWAARGLWLGLLAAGVAGWGEIWLFQEPLRAQGAALQVLGIGLGVLAWGNTPAAPILPAGTERRWWAIAWRRGL